MEGTPLPVLEWAWGRRRQRGRGGSWGWSHRALLAIVRAVASPTREAGAVGGRGVGQRKVSGLNRITGLEGSRAGPVGRLL